MAQAALLALGSGGIPLGGFAFASGVGSALSTLGTISTIGSITSPLLAARSKSQSASFERAQLNLQAKTQEAQTLQSANEIKRRMIADLASANAAFGSRGVSTSSGTPVQAAAEAVRVANRNVDIAFTGGMAAQNQNRLQSSQFKQVGSSAIQGGLFESLSKAGSVM